MKMRAYFKAKERESSGFLKELSVEICLQKSENLLWKNLSLFGSSRKTSKVQVQLSEGLASMITCKVKKRDQRVDRGEGGRSSTYLIIRLLKPGIILPTVFALCCGWGGGGVGGVGGVGGGLGGGVGGGWGGGLGGFGVVCVGWGCLLGGVGGWGRGWVWGSSVAHIPFFSPPDSISL